MLDARKGDSRVASAVAKFEEKQPKTKSTRTNGAKAAIESVINSTKKTCHDKEPVKKEKEEARRRGGESSSSGDEVEERIHKNPWPPSGSSASSSSDGGHLCSGRQPSATRDCCNDFQWAGRRIDLNPFLSLGRSRRSLDLPKRRDRRERNLKTQSCLMHNPYAQCCHYQHFCQPPTRYSNWDLCLLGKGNADMEERLLRLEGERDALQLQVQVLGEQLTIQAEKIADLSECLEEKRHQLKSAENLLQREMLTRSSLETQKLELMSTISELKLAMATVERENLDLKEERRRAQAMKPPINTRTGNPFTNHVADAHANNPFASTPNDKTNLSGSPSMSPVSFANNLRREIYAGPVRRSLDQFSSLPRQKIAEYEAKKALSGNRKLALITLKSEKSYSAPNLADVQRLSQRPAAAELDLAVPVEITPGRPSEADGKTFKKIFVKLRRSHSGNVNDIGGDLQRGGVRATAGPRLAPVLRIREIVDLPLAQWNKEQVCSWLEELGLENYVSDARRWIQGGAHLLSASIHDLEKELGIKNPLHKKKLLLAIQALQGGAADELLNPAGLLDTHWVLRWLDDIGLPQYKDVFLTGRVDGRVLHRLTMDDLATLHITSVLHIASLRRGIQVLREHKMDGNCLTRRSLPGESDPTPAEVSLWTNHRVMEWLRAVDLAEYAPNLRGSGVHGALMIHEIKFTGELLASLLNIPPSKTLLRRHLSTHFNELLGRDIVQNKREAETTLGYIPLTPTAKLKTIKRTQFTLKRKKSKNELDFGDLVCPLNAGHTSGDERSSGDGMMTSRSHVPDVCPLTESTIKGRSFLTQNAFTFLGIKAKDEDITTKWFQIHSVGFKSLKHQGYVFQNSPVIGRQAAV